MLSQIIQRAKQGSMQDLGILSMRISGNDLAFSLEILQAFLPHLDRNAVPDVSRYNKDKPLTEPVSRAILGTFTLPAAYGMIKNLPQRQQSDAIKALLGAFNGLIAWISFFLHFGLSIPMDQSPGRDNRVAYFGNAIVLFGLFNLSPEFKDAVRASPAAIDTIIRLWTTTGKKGQFYQRLNVPGQQCPISLLMHDCLMTIPVKRPFFKQIAANQRTLAPVMITGIIERCRQVERMIEERSGTIEDANTHFFALCDVAADVLADPKLQQLATRLELMKNMETTAILISKKTQDKPTLSLLSIQSLIHAAVTDSAKPVHNFVELLKGPIIPTFLRITSKRLPSDAFQFGLGILDIVGTTLQTYPEVPDYFNAVFVHKYRSLFDELSAHPQEEIRMRWLLTMRTLAMALQALRSIQRPVKDGTSPPSKRAPEDRMLIRMCDNPSCPWIFSSKSANSRACQGCYSVVYCSTDCQKTDWKARHRKECSPAASMFFRQSSEETWYPHRVRSYHHACIEEHFKALQQADRRLMLHPALSINFRSPTPEPGARPRRPYVLNGGVTDVTPPHIKPRYEELVREMELAMAGNHPEQPLVRFVEAIHFWGPDSGVMFLLVKLKARHVLRVGSMEFKAVYSIPKVLYPS